MTILGKESGYPCSSDEQMNLPSPTYFLDKSGTSPPLLPANEEPSAPHAVTRVRRALRTPGLAPPQCSSQMAKRLAMSERALRRALRNEGTSFRVLQDEFRREATLRLLSSPDLSVTDVALMVGFSEASALHRAFKRWTGLTPRQFQQLATAPAESSEKVSPEARAGNSVTQVPLLLSASRR